MWFHQADEPSIVLGTHGPWYHRQQVRLLGHDISEHKWIIGTTGHGKSKLIASMCVQYYAQGIPFCLIDPAAELADEVMLLLADSGHFPNQQPHQAIRYIDFSRRDCFLPFNVLKQPYPIDQVAEHLIEVCLRAWPQLAGGNAATFERLMRNTVKVLVANGLPITHVGLVLNDRAYRDMLLSRMRDPWVVDFFRRSFDRWGREEENKKESTLNRGDLLTASDVMRYSLGQPENALNFRTIMEEQRSLIVNLNGLAEQEQRFLGAFIAHGFEQAAYARGAPNPVHPPYMLILDEFPMFTAQSEAALANVLSRTRKYGLYLTLAHQTFSQVSERLLGALQNAILFAFRVGARDARILAEDLTEFDPSAIKQGVIGEGAAERQIGGFVGVPESYQLLKDKLKGMPKRQVYLKARTQATEFRTIDVPPHTTTRDELHAIKDAYARHLMTPREAAVPLVDAAVMCEPNEPPGI